MAKNKISVKWIAIYEDMFTHETIAECAEKSNVDNTVIIVALQQIYMLIAKRGNGENKVDRVSVHLLHSFVNKSQRKAAEIMRNIASFGLVNIEKRGEKLRDIEVVNWCEYQKPLSDSLKEQSRNAQTSRDARERKKREKAEREKNSTDISTGTKTGKITGTPVNNNNNNINKEHIKDLVSNSNSDLKLPPPEIPIPSVLDSNAKQVEDMNQQERIKHFNQPCFKTDPKFGDCTAGGKTKLAEYITRAEEVAECYGQIVKRAGYKDHACDAFLKAVATYSFDKLKESFESYKKETEGQDMICGVNGFFIKNKHEEHIKELKPKKKHKANDVFNEYNTEYFQIADYLSPEIIEDIKYIGMNTARIIYGDGQTASVLHERDANNPTADVVMLELYHKFKKRDAEALAV